MDIDIEIEIEIEIEICILIDACARAGEAALAQRMAWDMVKEGLRPSTHTFVLLAKAYLRASLPTPTAAEEDGGGGAGGGGEGVRRAQQ